jgi:hypothetical protein
LVLCSKGAVMTIKQESKSKPPRKAKNERLKEKRNNGFASEGKGF